MQLHHILLFILTILTMSLAMKGLKSRPKRQRQLQQVRPHQAASESWLAIQPFSKHWVPETLPTKQRTTFTTTTPAAASITLSVVSIPTKSGSTRIKKRNKKPNTSTFRISKFAGPVVTKVPLTEKTYATTREDSVSFEGHKFVFGTDPVRFAPVGADPVLLYPVAPVSEKSSIDKEVKRMKPVQSHVTDSFIKPVAPPVVHEVISPFHRTSPATPPPVTITVPLYTLGSFAPPVVTRMLLPPPTPFPSLIPPIAPPVVHKVTSPPLRTPSATPPNYPPVLTTVPQPPFGSFAPPVVTRVPSSPPTSSNITTQNATRISKEQNSGRWVIRLCGYPAICDFDQCVSLNITSDPLINCEVPGAAAAFGLAAILMGLVIVLGNLLMPIVVWKQQDMRNRHNYIKVSLAISDMIVGAILLFFTLPSMIWLRNSTESEILQAVTVTERNSWRAILAGSLFLLAQEASLLHLVFLSIERFSAIKWPFWHRQRSTRTVLLTLAALWIASILLSFSPVFFPDRFEYNLIPVALNYMMSAVALSDGSLGYHIIVFSVVTFVIPFVVMVIFTSLTGIIVWRKFRSSKRKRIVSAGKANEKDSRSDEQVNTVTKSSNSAEEVFHSVATRDKKVKHKIKLKPEVSVFITIVIMITAFSVTLIPVSVVLILFNTGYYNCTNYSVAFCASLFAALMNGFANVIIYSARDDRFRKAVSATFSLQQFTMKQHSRSPSNGNNTSSV